MESKPQSRCTRETTMGVDDSAERRATPTPSPRKLANEKKTAIIG
jgi:hypothetical protein